MKEFPAFVTNVIIEVLINLRLGNLPISPKDKLRLTNYLPHLNHLIELPNQKERRNFLYEEKSGFIPTSLPLILSVVIALV